MSPETRPDWDEYFLDIARTVALRADCRRRQYGAVVVKHNRIVSTGYNGAPAGEPGCLSGACPRGLLGYEEIKAFTDYENGPGRCISIHAEANAIIYADYDRLRGATIYVSDVKGENGKPCSACDKLIHGAGIRQVVFPEGTYLTASQRGKEAA